MTDKSKWHIGITDFIEPPADIEQQAFPDAEYIFLPDWHKNKEPWSRVDALLVWHWPIDTETIQLLKQCRIVIRYGVGYDLVDVRALENADILFCNTPDYGTEEVADTASSMILALTRKLFQYDRLCRNFKTSWQENRITPHQRTNKLTLGLVGVGRIGTAVVNRMKPFGYRIVGYDPYKPSGHEKAVGYDRVHSLKELLQQADIVSLHCPLTSETRGLVNQDFISSVKPGAVLVNTARGKILANLNVIENALSAGHLSGAAFDCLPSEPPQPHPLLQAWRDDAEWLQGRLIITPHTAWHSDQAWYEMRYKAAETAKLYLEEGILRNHIRTMEN